MRDLKSLDPGLGGAIVTLTRQVELARATLDEARAASRDTRQDLAQLVAKADAAAGQLRLLIAAAARPPPPPRARAAAGRPSPTAAPAAELARRGSSPSRSRGRRPAPRRPAPRAPRRGAEAAGARADREPAPPRDEPAPRAGAQRGRHPRGADRARRRPLSHGRTPAPALSGVGLIVVCFFASAALRLTDDGWALAEGIGEAAGAARGAGRGRPTTRTRSSRRFAHREAQLDAEEKRLADRRQTLSVAEAKLAEQLAAFEKAQKNLEKTLALADQAAERDIARMTTVYENMKPADAARIFERMDVGFAAGLLARMRPGRRGAGADRHEARDRLCGHPDHRQPQRRRSRPNSGPA